MTTTSAPSTSSRPMPRIEQWVAALERRRSALTDPERIAELDLLIEHLVAEHERDLPRTMRTVSPRGGYHSWGGAKPYTATTPEQEVLYRKALDGSPNTFNLCLEVERFFSGPDGICMDGVLHKELTGQAVLDMGFALPDGADPSGTFVVSRRMALFVSYLDGLMAGEDMYRDDHGVVTTADEWARGRVQPQP
jgi:hypothetical protein